MCKWSKGHCLTWRSQKLGNLTIQVLLPQPCWKVITGVSCASVYLELILKLVHFNSWSLMCAILMHWGKSQAPLVRVLQPLHMASVNLEACTFWQLVTQVYNSYYKSHASDHIASSSGHLCDTSRPRYQAAASSTTVHFVLLLMPSLVLFCVFICIW